MPVAATPRFAFPFLEAAQSFKEITHNEALTRADMLIAPQAQAVPLNTPPASPQPGQCWVIGAAPTGAWAGKAQHLAGYSDGGWRFAAPVAGMTAWVESSGVLLRYTGGQWQIPGIIAAPAGGVVVDAESRTAIAAILARLSAAGIID